MNKYLIAVLLGFGCALSYSAPLAPVDSGASVNIEGRELFRLHDKIGAFGPRDRAEAASRRIEKLAANHLFSTEALVAKDEGTESDILANDLIVVSLTDRDAKPLSIDRNAFAETVLNSIRSGVDLTRREHAPQRMLEAVGGAAALTFALVLVLWALSRAYRYSIGRLRGWKFIQNHGIKLRGFEFLSAERLRGIIEVLARALYTMFILIVFYIYLPLTLSRFPQTANLAPRLYGYILNPLRHVGQIMLDFVPNLFFIAVILLVTRFILKFIRLLFKEIERGTIQFDGFHTEWSQPTYKLVRILVFALALVIVFPYLPGAGSPAFQGVSVFLGILFSFGSSSAVGNMVAGIVLTYMRPFHVGDRVKIADTVGDVLEKTILATRIRTIKNVEITIPNSMVLSNHIINYSAGSKAEGLIIHTTVTIGYDAPWPKVHELLIAAALRTSRILPDPRPFVLQTSLDDFYVSYEINAYTRDASSMARIHSELHQNIQAEFNGSGVEIMSPHYNSVRDGNDVTIPSEHLPKNYESPRFKVTLSSSSSVRAP